jgi:hypothetical protein
VRGDPNLEIVWINGRGMVWSNSPIHYTANVILQGNEYSIHTSGCYGLTAEQREVLEKHLQSLGYSPWEKE